LSFYLYKKKSFLRGWVMANLCICNASLLFFSHLKHPLIFWKYSPSDYIIWNFPINKSNSETLSFSIVTEVVLSPPKMKIVWSFKVFFSSPRHHISSLLKYQKQGVVAPSTLWAGSRGLYNPNWFLVKKNYNPN